MSLQALRLNYNTIQGTLPSLTGLSQLTDLELSSNLLSGSLPSRDEFPNNLRAVSLDGNELTGSLRAFQGMTELVFLNLNNNSFVSETLPPTFWTNFSTDMGTLTLENLRLRGSVSELLQNLIRLTSLDLTGNDFTGTLPTNVGDLKDLGEFQLHSVWSECGFRIRFGANHELSSFVASVSRSQEILILQSNRLTGQIPSELGLCNSLQELDLTGNHFVGHVPATLGNLTKLGELKSRKDDGNVQFQLFNCLTPVVAVLSRTCFI